MPKYPLIPILALLAAAANAPAQCAPEWSGHGETQGALAFAVWDKDGSGPARPTLVAGGGYRRSPPIQLNMIGTFDGRVWRPLGEGLGTAGSVKALSVAETSGVGSPAPGIYAAGSYSRVAGEPSRYVSRWDGSTWNHIGETIGIIHSLMMFDEDGPGLKEANLFVGGSPFEVAGLDWPGLYRWNGTQPSLVGGSLQATPGGRAKVLTMIIFDDDGPGPRPPALYVAGSFQTAGGLTVNNIARWDGTNWEALDFGISGGVDALAVFDADGDGPQRPMLYAAAPFRTTPGGNFSTANLSRWDGTQWAEVTGYTGGGVESMQVIDDDGDGPNPPSLFISGLFNSINGVFSPGIIRYDGTQWHAVDGGIGGIAFAHANAMGIFDEDGDPATPPGLYLGGSFLTAGGQPAPGLARWGCPLATCIADCDASTGLNVLDIFDFLCFQNNFVTNNPDACNCDTSTGNGVCDMLDFLCFQQAYISGCP